MTGFSNNTFDVTCNTEGIFVIYLGLPRYLDSIITIPKYLIAFALGKQ